MERERPHPRSGRPGKGNAKHCLIITHGDDKGGDYCDDHGEDNDDGGCNDDTIVMIKVMIIVMIVVIHVIKITMMVTANLSPQSSLYKREEILLCSPNGLSHIPPPE